MIERVRILPRLRTDGSASPLCRTSSRTPYASVSLHTPSQSPLAPKGWISPKAFFAKLHWIDGRPLEIEPYRQSIFDQALWTFAEDGTPRYNLILAGRGKKNWKSADLALAALYCLLCRDGEHPSDGFVLANDLDQASDDLSLVKKLIACNPEALGKYLQVKSGAIVRKDDRGTLRVLPAGDALGAHGKTASFIGYDEIHGYRDWSIMEALAPDPTRHDTLQWVTSYDSLLKRGPLHDLKAIGLAAKDPRMLFSWFSGTFATDPAFAELPPEERANPSMGTWRNGRKYLDQQRMRLPTHRYRRLHLNLPGAPEGAFLDADKVEACIIRARHRLPPVDNITYAGFVDMSGGSSDDAALAIGHVDPDTNKVIVDVVEKQSGEPPFNPRSAVKKFAGLLCDYRIAEVTGDAFGGETFRRDFQEYGIAYKVWSRSASDLYEQIEPKINAGEVELLDHPTLIEQFLTLVWAGTKITHQVNDHDDHANAVAGLVNLLVGRPVFERRAALIAPSIISDDGPDSYRRRPRGHPDPYYSGE